MLALMTAPGCAGPLDKARAAWADGDGDLDEAESLYRQAMQDPDVGDLATQELVEIYVEIAKQQARKKPKGARRYYARALELDPDSAEARVGLARVQRDLGQLDDAIAIVTAPQAQSCRECRRLEAILLIRRADARMEAGQWAAAEDDYGRAAAILPDSAVALGIVRARLARKDIEAAIAGLRQASDLVGAHDATARRHYLELRRAAVLLAIEQDRVPLADELLDLVPAGVGPEEQLGLAMEVALQFRKRGKPDLALQRMQALVEAAERGRLALPAERQIELRQQVASLYAARGSLRLTTGKVDAAARDVARALQLRPDDEAVQLQRVLVLAAKDEHTRAQAELAKLDGVQGHAQVGAILAALQVERLVARGDLAAANETLARAKALAGELPEVHVAIAQVLAVTPPSDLRKPEMRALAREGLVSYPNGRVTRVGEALSELDWARQQIRGLGPQFPYRGPDTLGRIEALRAEIGAFYPYAVSFQGDPSTVLELKNPGKTAVSVQVRAGDFSAEMTVQPGAAQRVTVPDPGLIRLRWRGTDAVFLGEPYTRVELPL